MSFGDVQQPDLAHYHRQRLKSNQRTNSLESFTRKGILRMSTRDENLKATPESIKERRSFEMLPANLPLKATRFSVSSASSEPNLSPGSRPKINSHSVRHFKDESENQTEVSPMMGDALSRENTKDFLSGIKPTSAMKQLFQSLIPKAKKESFSSKSSQIRHSKENQV